MNENSLVRLVIAMVVTAGSVYACNTGGQPFVPGSGGAGDGTAGGNAGESGAPSGSGGRTSGAAGSGGTVVIPVPDAAPDAPFDGHIDPDAACGTGYAEATLRPLRMLVMFDRSGSMIHEDTIDPETQLDRWQTATVALRQFFEAPEADGIGVALRFFPDDRPAPGCTQEGCSAEACADVLVEAGELSAAAAPEDAQEALLVTEVEASTPMEPPPGTFAMGGTPISVALEGAATWARAQQEANPEQRTVIVFVTDGEPRGCDERFSYIWSVASDVLEHSDVATFAVGLTDASGEGLNREDMDQLASSGGTEQAFFISDGPTASAELLAALNAIRGEALPCDFPMPEATSEGKPIDTGLVNVTYTSGEDQEETFSKVPNADECRTALAWYYDDEDEPTRIHLCPAACDTVTAGARARLRVLVGCATILEPPPR